MKRGFMNLEDFFKKYNKIALAFSGGVDSAYLLYAAKKAGCDITSYYIKSQFQPQFELEDAKRLAKELDAKMKIIEIDAISDCKVRENSSKRCYYCKKNIFTHILQAAKEDGFRIIIDGTNASDDAADRPGMTALTELSVLSPLRMCGLTKEEIRMLSKEAGLFTWNKPAYACLATRIPCGDEITLDKLIITEKCEETLMKLGFADFRIRNINGTAKIQVTEKQFHLVMEHRKVIIDKLKAYYKNITLDLEVRE